MTTHQSNTLGSFVLVFQLISIIQTTVVRSKTSLSTMGMNLLHLGKQTGHGTV